MQTARSASETHWPSRSAVEYTATASMPRSWQARISRTAASPRFAIRTRLSIRPSPRLHGFQLEQRLPVLDRLGVLDQHRADHARVLRLELVEELHGLEDAQRLADLDPVALVDERALARARRAVEGADHRRLDLDRLRDARRGLRGAVAGDGRCGGRRRH